MRYAGVHWPENANGEHPSPEYILSLPGIRLGCSLICTPSARWWYPWLKKVSPLAVWRCIPEPRDAPALLNWEPNRAVNAALIHYNDDQYLRDSHVGVEYVQLWNELQFEKENGRPFPGYSQMAQNLARAREAARGKLSAETKLIFPPWVPSDDGTYLDDWKGEAEQWDVIGLHAYGSPQAIWDRYWSYRRAFPNHPIFVGEWNANHEGHDERALLATWAKIQERDGNGFLGATYFIWETNNAGEQDLSIWGNAGRLELFFNPPTAAEAPELPSPEDPPAPLPDPPAPVPEPEPEGPIIVARPQGIDIANYQGFPNFDVLKQAGYSFVIAKATEGTGYQNENFTYQWSKPREAGLYRGAYHFGRPDRNSAEAEAEFFTNVVVSNGLEVGDFLALDFEHRADVNSFGVARARGVDLGLWALQFLKAVEARVGFAPLIYTGMNHVTEEQLWRFPELGRFGLWLAYWGNNPPPPPAPWELVAFWQDNVWGFVPGVSGEVDHDYFMGDEASIPLYGKRSEPIPIPEPVPFPEPGPEDPPPAPERPAILKAMDALEDHPISPENYGTDMVTQLGASGRLYVYSPVTGKVYSYGSDAVWPA